LAKQGNYQKKHCRVTARKGKLELPKLRDVGPSGKTGNRAERRFKSWAQSRGKRCATDSLNEISEAVLATGRGEGGPGKQKGKWEEAAGDQARKKKEHTGTSLGRISYAERGARPFPGLDQGARGA